MPSAVTTDLGADLSAGETQQLASLVAAWPHLPDGVRQAILLLLQPWVKQEAGDAGPKQLDSHPTEESRGGG